MPTTEMIMLMTLSHCVVVKASLVFGSTAGVSTVEVSTAGVSTAGVSTAGDSTTAFAFLSCSFAMMISASAIFFSAPLVPAAFSRQSFCQLQRFSDF